MCLHYNTYDTVRLLCPHFTVPGTLLYLLLYLYPWTGGRCCTERTESRRFGPNGSRTRPHEGVNNNNNNNRVLCCPIIRDGFRRAHNGTGVSLFEMAVYTLLPGIPKPVRQLFPRGGEVVSETRVRSGGHRTVRTRDRNKTSLPTYAVRCNNNFKSI